MATSDEPRIELVSRRLALRNAVFEVFLDEIIDQEARRTADYLSVVPHAAAADAVSGVAVLPVRGDEVGLLRVFRHPQAAAGWEVPMGFIEADEPLERAAVRELEEETGYTAARMANLGRVAPVASIVRARVQIFAAIDVREAAAGRSGELGHGRLAFFDASAAMRMAEAGEIEDSATLVALYRFMARQR